MATLSICDSCAGFLAPRTAVCPHCGHTPTRSPKARIPGGKLLSAACSGAVALTLMACYGSPPQGPPPACPDRDGDGFYGGPCHQNVPADCDDKDPAVHPGAEDPEGDGIDQNCDGADGNAGDGATPGDPAEARAESPPGAATTGPGTTTGAPTSTGTPTSSAAATPAPAGE